jgi:hypothetical protein
MKRKYRLIRGTEILLWSVGIGVLSFYLLKILPIGIAVAATIAFVITSALAFLSILKTNIFGVREKDLAMYLNRHYPALQESADLLLKKDEELTRLQLLQKVRTSQQFDKIYPTIKLPHRIGRAIVVFALSVISSAALTAFSNQAKLSESAGSLGKEIREVARENLPANVRRATIDIFPPPYTQVPAFSSADFNLEIPEASKVRWDMIFEGEISNPMMIFSGKDSARIEPTQNGYRLEKSFYASGYYQLVWTNADSSVHYSNYFAINIKKDHAPALTIENLNQYVVLSERDNLKVTINSKLTDDYGLSRAQIIATVSKGSGESIKFREEKLTFDSPAEISGKHVRATRMLDLIQLGLQPGDELYFYIEAEDNKTPVPNYARTETYFIELPDTSSATASMEAGLGVDLMPEYFRSQRQIIIDSEKLLQERKTISKEKFNSESNALAHDEKVLRLRYGEFLGEEFQSSVGPQGGITDEQAENVEETFGHSHDTDHEHTQLEENNTGKDGRETGEKRPSSLNDFVHSHDSDEEATFFIRSIKAKLRAAVAIMWDAELYLRLYQPEKSLPYQYQALKLLKEISQDSRIYVHRTGFDPPPLKEEKRFTGDLSEIRNSTLKERIETDKQYLNIRTALAAIGKLQQEDSVVLTKELKDLLTKAGVELGEIALQKPGKYLTTLSLLNSVIHDGNSGPLTKKNSLTKISQDFWEVLPQEIRTPQARSVGRHDLDLQFLKNLEQSNQP